jgi:Zn-dependent protease
MPLDQHWLADRLFILIPLWFSLSVHEWAHAWAAWRLGDDTAALAGRLTLNPLAHMDPVGTVLLPLLGVPFGWAKPVPVQPHRFHRGVNMRTGMMLTAVAGPLANLALAFVGIVLVVVLIRFQPAVFAARRGVGTLVQNVLFLNVVLAVFNMLPIPPLDGSRVADALMPRALRSAWEGFCGLGPLPLIAVIVLPTLTGVSLFYWPMEGVRYVIEQLAMLLGR